MMLLFLTCLLAVFPGVSAKSLSTLCRIQFPGVTEIRPIPKNAPFKRCTSSRHHTAYEERPCLKMDQGSRERMAILRFKSKDLSSLGIIYKKKDLDLEPSISMSCYGVLGEMTYPCWLSIFSSGKKETNLQHIFLKEITDSKCKSVAPYKRDVF